MVLCYQWFSQLISTWPSSLPVWHCMCQTYIYGPVWYKCRYKVAPFGWPIIFTSVTLWQCDSVTVWHCDGVMVWQCDIVTVWQCDIMMVWWCDIVTVWRCDSVAVLSTYESCTVGLTIILSSGVKLSAIVGTSLATSVPGFQCNFRLRLASS